MFPSENGDGDTPLQGYCEVWLSHTQIAQNGALHVVTA